MSYFDDNEEQIIYGSRRHMARGIGRAKPADPGYDVGQVDVVKKAASGKAVLCRWTKDGDLKEEWFPFSQVHENSELTADNCEEGEEYQLVVTTWIAQQKSLEDGDGF